MVDDFITGGLPIDIDTSGDGDFDPNAVESDDFLPDDPAEILDDSDLSADPLAAEDDDLFEEI